MNDRPRALVFGYSEVGYACLESLIRRGVLVVGVITHEDDPNEKLWFRSVAALANANGIPVFKPESVRNDPAMERLVRDALKPDIVFSFYYRQMIPMTLLRGARLGAFNMHGSFLPTYRGKAPVNWAILNGEDHTGATLHHMIARADAGDIVDQQRVSIGDRDTSANVMKRVVEAAARVLDRQLDALMVGRAPRRVQDESQATYFGGRKPDDGRIDWTWSSQRIFNLIRAVTRPFPGAFADMPGKGRLKIWWAEHGEQKGRAGEILKTDPLTIATGDSALQITDFEWSPAGSGNVEHTNSHARMVPR